MKKQLVAGIVSPESNYVLMPGGSFAPPSCYKKAWQFEDEVSAASELAKHLPAFVKSEQKRTQSPFIVNGEFCVPHSEFELSVDEINARQAARASV